MKFMLILSVTIFFFMSCKKENTLETEIEKINTDIEIERFDMLFSKTTPKTLPALKDAYPFMFSEKYSDSFWLKKNRDTLQIELFNEVDKTFSDFKKAEAEIESLYNHLKYYYPGFKVPRIITATSDVDYRNRIIATDTITLIALDSYLGNDHKFYGGIAKFLKANFKKSHIVVDLCNAYAKKYIHQPNGDRFIDDIIYAGKLLYFNDVMLPFKAEWERMGYSNEELDWAQANESYIWRFFVSRELLFSTDRKLANRFINPAPFSKFYLEKIDADSPGRLGRYIGLQMVRAYMQQNDVDLKDMFITSTDDIFNNTKFKPRK